MFQKTLPREIRVTRDKRQCGGAIIEYIIVTAFSAVFGIAAITFMGSMLKEKIDQLASELNMEEDFEFEISLFQKNESE